MTAVRRASTAFLVVLCCGCSSKEPPCSDVMPNDQPALFHLSCGPADLTSVAISGPCSVGDASPSTHLYGSADRDLAFRSSAPGRRHVVLTFATGFIYSADITFTSQSSSQSAGCGATSYVGPTQQSFAVDNPAETCVNAMR